MSLPRRRRGGTTRISAKAKALFVLITYPPICTLVWSGLVWPGFLARYLAPDPVVYLCCLGRGYHYSNGIHVVPSSRPPSPLLSGFVALPLLRLLPCSPAPAPQSHSELPVVSPTPLPLARHKWVHTPSQFRLRSSRSSM